MLDTLNAILLAAEQGVRYEDYSICLKVFLILMVVAAVAIIVVIMMQKGTNDNVGVITGASDTYYGKNKSTNKESVLKRSLSDSSLSFSFARSSASLCGDLSNNSHHQKKVSKRLVFRAVLFFSGKMRAYSTLSGLNISNE